MDETIGTDMMDEMKFENQGTDQAPEDGLVCRDAESLSGLTSKDVEEIFLILAVLLCLVGSYRNLTFLPIVIGNTVIGILQELRAKRVLDKMNMLNVPHAVAVRDGRQIRIPSEELVQNDVVLLSAGDQICADAKVLSGNLSVNDPLLTGEADEIRKEAGCDLLSGSFVVSGQCLARLERVGDASYVSRLSAQALSGAGGTCGNWTCCLRITPLP